MQMTGIDVTTDPRWSCRQSAMSKQRVSNPDDTGTKCAFEEAWIVFRGVENYGSQWFREVSTQVHVVPCFYFALLWHPEDLPWETTVLPSPLGKCFKLLRGRLKLVLSMNSTNIFVCNVHGLNGPARCNVVRKFVVLEHVSLHCL